MSLLLPITLHGPITTLSRWVRTAGVLEGAEVEITADGTPVGGGVADKDGQNLIKLDTSLLSEGQSLTGTQTIQSRTSSPSRYPVEVQGVKLTPPTLKSVLQTCMTDIIVDNLRPGATLVTRIDGTVFGETLVLPSNVPIWCGIDRETSIAAGARIEIVQKVTIEETENEGPSPALPPAPSFEPREGLLPPGIIGKAIQCDTELAFSNMVPGARNEIQGTTQNQSWLNPSELFTGVDSLPLEPGVVDATANVEPLTSLEAPRVETGLCKNLLRFAISRLQPKGRLNISFTVQAPDGVTTTTPLGQRPFDGKSESVELPADLPFDAPGVFGLRISQTRCGVTSPTAIVSLQGGDDPTDGTGVRFAAALFECAVAIPLENVFPGSVVQAFGPNGNAISDAVQAVALTLLLPVYFPLEEGTIIVVQTGCKTSFKPRATVQALPTPLASPRAVEPIRPDVRSVKLKGVLSGATVFVLVDGLIQSAPVQIYGELRDTVFLQRPLEAKQTVTALRLLCDQTSTIREGDSVTVNVGTMKLGGFPSSAVRDTTVTFTVTARDADTGDQIAATIDLNGSRIGSTGQPIRYSPRLGDPNPTFTVSSPPAYADQTFSIGLVDPLRDWTLTIETRPIPAYITGTFIYIRIYSLSFDLVPSWDPSAARKVTPTLPAQESGGFPSVASGSVRLPIPTGGNKTVRVTISGLATAFLAGSAQVPIVSTTPTWAFDYAGNSNLVIGWLLIGSGEVIDPISGAAVYRIEAVTGNPS